MTTSIGISYHMGWFCCAVVEKGANDNGIEVLQTGRVETHSPGDRASEEPYHVAGGWQGLERVPVPGDPAEIVNRGLEQQRLMTFQNLKEFLKRYTVIDAAGILVGRGRRAENLQQAINSHTQIHMAEANAVCDAIEDALGHLNIKPIRLDRKTLFESADNTLKLSREELMGLLKSRNPGVGPWRQEEKNCAIAAWLAASV